GPTVEIEKQTDRIRKVFLRVSHQHFYSQIYDMETFIQTRDLLEAFKGEVDTGKPFKEALFLFQNQLPNLPSFDIDTAVSKGCNIEMEMHNTEEAKKGHPLEAGWSKDAQPQ